MANVAPVNVTKPPVMQTQQVLLTDTQTDGKALTLLCVQVEATTVQKPPIPQEHMWLVQGLDGMVDRCKTAATSGVSVECFVTIEISLRSVGRTKRSASEIFLIIKMSKICENTFFSLHPAICTLSLGFFVSWLLCQEKF